MKSTFVNLGFSIAILSSLLANGSEIRVAGIPYSLEFENEALNFEHLENGGIRFESPAHCDLFHSADGNYVVNKSPRLLFKPDADFSLSAKITVDFHERWDAGDLIVYNDELHWAKFCFEADFNHQPRVVSVVCNGIADDCNSMPIEGNVMYYRIAGSLHGKKMVLYCSTDGDSWFPIRFFFLKSTESLRIGFCVQSPAGEGCTASFEAIQYSNQPIKNWWVGE